MNLTEKVFHGMLSLRCHHLPTLHPPQPYRMRLPPHDKLHALAPYRMSSADLRTLQLPTNIDPLLQHLPSTLSHLRRLYLRDQSSRQSRTQLRLVLSQAIARTTAHLDGASLAVTSTVLLTLRYMHHRFSRHTV